MAAFFSIMKVIVVKKYSDFMTVEVHTFQETINWNSEQKFRNFYMFECEVDRIKKKQDFL